MSDFVIAGHHLIAKASISYLDLSAIEQLIVIIHFDGKCERVEGVQAIECLMQLRPSAFENKRLRWKKRAWAVHNLIGHPLMQLLAYFHYYKYAMFIHDITVPRPIGRK